MTPLLPRSFVPACLDACKGNPEAALTLAVDMLPEVKRRLAAGEQPSHYSHGTVSAYRAGCRCDRCRIGTSISRTGRYYRAKARASA